ncbi:hypothetical protein SAMN04244560_01019 [Thermoanaerobacter thermohydrosulfuricus]|uniref:MORN repeat variant n=1 Tax=Thermoanaerobacter thermohydrosulfuricus TaxID=1516 RepID=A0A1G7MSV8_THETY|nr:hypothetical protein [Thermoanaerobacter thermohydrosulfuricus]SDF64928.1 hypothetical protein SAMN04244560_01019 [Thermoanaerobacter thermohydrosulfuricus]
MSKEKLTQKIEYWDSGKIKRIEYYKEVELHRDNGPAVIEYDHNGNIMKEEWYKENIIDREDGPAVVTYYTKRALMKFLKDMLRQEKQKLYQKLCCVQQ